LSIRQIVGEIRLARIGGKRCTRPLLVFILFFVGGCASQTTISKPRPQGTYHVVTPGETLFRIGKAYGVTYQELARVNGIKDAAQIRVGQRIFIPGATRPLPVETITPAEPVPAAPVSPEPGFETFLWPVNGTINSGFGPRGSSFHDGIDIAAPEGTPILAIEAGEVIYSDQLRGYGNMVILRHAGGIVSVYAHNEANLVREGQSVVRGEVVARVGSTGRVSGPHLHFEIRRNNAAQDPLRYLPQLCCVTASDNVSPKN
jgi:murein DD-endopeptidase MepM/ murein hydrolase activator NlpD